MKLSDNRRELVERMEAKPRDLTDSEGEADTAWVVLSLLGILALGLILEFAKGGFLR